MDTPLEKAAPRDDRAPGAELAGGRRGARLAGIDLARAVALLGMMATHTLPLLDAAAQPQPVALIAGKAAALFAVLAGVSVELSTRRYPRWRDAALALVIRGALIAVVGLLLGSVAGSIAVVLVQYGVMFALAPLVLRAPTRALAVLAPLWLLASPVLSHLVRDATGAPRAAESLELVHVAQPGYLLTATFLTGYYPVLQWFGYLLVGLLLARCDWRRLRTAVVALTAGAVVALAAWGASRLLLAGGGDDALARSGADRGLLEWGSPYAARYFSSYGTTPTDTWWWLATAGPHSSTPLDLAYTSGIAAAAIGVCFLICRALGEGRLLVSPLLAAGSMPLTMYSLHVIMSGFMPVLLIQVVLLLVLATVWRLGPDGPGPLEGLIAGAVRRAVG